jgi:hypothetical protein
MRGRKEYDLAEEVLASFYEAKDRIRAIRSPFGYQGEGSSRKASVNESDAEKQIYDQAYVATERYQKYQDVFNKLHAQRYRFMALFGIEKAKPFDELQSVLNDIFIAANMLSFYWKRQEFARHMSNDEFAKHLKEMEAHESVFWKKSEENDAIDRRVNAIISEIEPICAKVIQKKPNRLLGMVYRCRLKSK